MVNRWDGFTLPTVETVGYGKLNFFSVLSRIELFSTIGYTIKIIDSIH